MANTYFYKKIIDVVANCANVQVFLDDGVNTPTQIGVDGNISLSNLADADAVDAAASAYAVGTRDQYLADLVAADQAVIDQVANEAKANAIKVNTPTDPVYLP